jgi:hypothetical protein
MQFLALLKKQNQLKSADMKDARSPNEIK